jgi:hypothetical protein
MTVNEAELRFDLAIHDWPRCSKFPFRDGGISRNRTLKENEVSEKRVRNRGVQKYDLPSSDNVSYDKNAN